MNLYVKEESLATYELKNYYVIVPNASTARNKNKIKKSLKKLKSEKSKRKTLNTVQTKIVIF